MSCESFRLSYLLALNPRSHFSLLFSSFSPVERSTASLSEKLGWPLSPSCAFNLHSRAKAKLIISTYSIGMALTFFTILPWQAKHYARVNDECTKNGLPVPPEARLPSMMVGAGLLPIGFLCVSSQSHFPSVLADSFPLAASLPGRVTPTSTGLPP